MRLGNRYARERGFVMSKRHLALAMRHVGKGERLVQEQRQRVQYLKKMAMTRRARSGSLSSLLRPLLS